MQLSFEPDCMADDLMRLHQCFWCVYIGWPALSSLVLRALAGKPGAAKRALLEQYGDTGLEASADGQCYLCLCGSLCRLTLLYIWS